MHTHRVTPVLLLAVSVLPVGSAGDIQVARLSIRPAIYQITNFANFTEMQALRAVAAGRYTRSGTAEDTGDERVRESTSFWVPRKEMQTDAVSRISSRIENTVVQIVRETNAQPAEQMHVYDVDPLYAEVFQMTQYSEGGFYAAHSDYSSDSRYDRAATFLLYLAAPPDGGETVFPYLSGGARNSGSGSATWQWNGCKDFRSCPCSRVNSSRVNAFKTHGLHYCTCEELLSVRPVAGDALLFFPLLKDGSKDQMAVHASCPVLSSQQNYGASTSVKEVVQQWFHASAPAPDTALHREELAKRIKNQKRTRRRQRRAKSDRRRVIDDL